MATTTIAHHTTRRQSPWVASYSDHPDLSLLERRVASTIASYANHKGRCWPALRTIADRLEIAHKTVDRVVHRLNHLGILLVQWGNPSPNPANRSPESLPVHHPQGQGRNDT